MENMGSVFLLEAHNIEIRLKLGITRD